MSKALKKKETQEWAMEKPNLDNARKWASIFTDPGDGEYKETIKHARVELEVLMEAAMPCKMETRKRAWRSRETVASENTNPRKKVCLSRGSSRVHKKAFGIYSSRKS